MFSDKYRFSLDPFLRNKYHENVSFYKIVAGIMLNCCTDLRILDKGPVTGKRYRDEMLEPSVRLFLNAVDGPNFILMDDNTTPNHAALVDDFFEIEH